MAAAAQQVVNNNDNNNDDNNDSKNDDNSNNSNTSNNNSSSSQGKPMFVILCYGQFSNYESRPFEFESNKLLNKGGLLSCAAGRKFTVIRSTSRCGSTNPMS